ncbi:hypothetical protein QVA66_02070 [Staphylococcus chromogenes]|nr:hypothetical protein [Staphylococcus chromogenes]
MSSMTWNNRSLAAVAMVAVAGLSMAACGKDEKSSTQGAASSVSSAVATSASSPATSASASTSASAPASSEPAASAEATSKSGQAKAPEAPKPAPAGAAAEQGLQPIQPAQDAPVQPVDGRPATQAEIDGITALLKRPEQQTTMHGYMNNMVDSLCTELIEQNGGREAFSFKEFPDLPLKDLPDYEATRTTLTGVDKVTVNGTDASASVTTSKTNGQSETNTMRFRNEGGNWKLCG